MLTTYAKRRTTKTLFAKVKLSHTLFLKANIELEKISEWFQASKLSLNEDKTRFTFFHKLDDRDRDRHDLPLQLPALKINNYWIERSSSIKFLRIMVDEHLNWNDHINIIENKLLNKQKQVIKIIPMADIHANLNSDE